MRAVALQLLLIATVLWYLTVTGVDVAVESPPRPLRSGHGTSPVDLARELGTVGGTAPRLEARVFPATGRGVGAATAIVRGEELLRVPRSAALSRHTPSVAAFHRLLTDRTGEANTAGASAAGVPEWEPGWLSMTLSLVCELLAADQGVDLGGVGLPRRYMATLPDHVDLSVWWPPSLVPNASNLAYETRKRGEELLRALDIAVALLNSTSASSPDAQQACRVPDMFGVKPLLDLSILARASDLLHSRAFYDDDAGSWVLVPYLDLFNYDPVAAHCDVCGVTGHGDSLGAQAHELGMRPGIDGDDYVLVATRAHSAGEEVFLDYYCKTNTELAVHYGFAVPNNPHASIHVRLLTDNEVADLPRLRRWALRRLGALPALTTHPPRVWTCSTELPLGLFQTARLIAASTKQLRARLASDPQSLLVRECRHDDPIDGAAAQFLTTWATARIAELPGSDGTVWGGVARPQLQVQTGWLGQVDVVVGEPEHGQVNDAVLVRASSAHATDHQLEARHRTLRLVMDSERAALERLLFLVRLGCGLGADS